MAERFRIAVVGVGRIGAFHARHVQELASERGDCALTAVVESYGNLASEVTAQLQVGQETAVSVFQDVEELIAANAADGAFIASRTENHYRDAQTLIDAGWRVLMEKPLTHSLATAREFAAYLDADVFRRTALMQAFMRASTLHCCGPKHCWIEVLSVRRSRSSRSSKIRCRRPTGTIAPAYSRIWRYTISTRSFGSAGSSPSDCWLGSLLYKPAAHGTSRRISTMPSCRCTFPRT